MAETNAEPQGTSEQAAPKAQPPIRRAWLIFPGGVCAGIAVAQLSKDWCCTTTAGVLVTLLAIAVVDRIVTGLFALNPQHCRKAQAISTIAIVCAIGWFFKLDEEAVFKQAIGITPPAGVKELVVDCNVTLAMNGDMIVLMRFVADEQTMGQLTTQRHFERNDEEIRFWKDGSQSWADMWKHTFSNFSDSGGDGWKQPQPMSQPVLYRWDGDEVLESTRLLWDAESGKAYVCYTLG